MLKNKTSALPLHQTGPAASPAPRNAISAALEKTINMVGLAATKTGSGDKERAYVVKQNSLLKAVLCFKLLALIVLLIAFNTVLEFRVQQRDWRRSEAVHFKRDHLDHESFLHISLELQEALEFTIEETHNIQEFRAFFARERAALEDAVNTALGGNVNPVVEKALQEFANEVEFRMERMTQRFERESANATDRVRQLAKRMGKEIDLDQRMERNFKARLQEWGVDEAYAEAAVDAYEEEYAAEEHVNEDPARVVQRRREGEKTAESEIIQHVERFFDKVRGMDLPEIPETVVKQLDIALSNFLDSLPEETKEADLGMFQAQMESILEPYPTVAKFDKSKHESLIDHYGSIIEKSKLVRHKQELMDLYNGWKTPGSKITEMNLLATIEQLAERDDMVKMFHFMEGRELEPLGRARVRAAGLKVVTEEAEEFDTVVEGEAPKLVKRTTTKLVRTQPEQEAAH